MKRSTAAWVCVAALAVAFGCSRRGGPSYPHAPVVLISIDTLRSDRLPAYGYATGATPALDAFRKDAVLYTRAYAHVPLTLPSHVTLFTGVLPPQHGVHDNLGYPIDPTLPTLAEHLARAGYRTGGAVSAAVLWKTSGIARGFESWDDAVEVTEKPQVLGLVQRSGGATLAALKTWLAAEDTTSGRPVFAFLHLYEPHSPYEPPEPFRSRFADPYDGEIAAADAVVGGLLADLKERGLYDRTVIIVLSDHGEGLFDHGEDEHGIFLYREALQVPLLVKLPGQAGAGATVTAPVGLFDVVPTILSLTRTAPEALAGLPGRPLPLPGEPAPPARRLFAETYYPRVHLGWSDLASLTDGTRHYIHAPRPEFYDLESDPAEKTDLAASRPEGFRSFRAELEKVPRSFAKPRAVDAEEARKLASLGYLTGSAGSEGGPLPDPKDGLPTLARMSEGNTALKEGRYAEAAAAYEALLESNPRMQDVWDNYSTALLRLGRFDDALAALKKGAEVSPESAGYLFVGIANLCLALGRPAEAEKHAEIALARGDPAAYAILARTALARGDVAAAEALAQKSLAALPRSRAPLLLLARVGIARGDLAGALVRLDEVDRKTAELKLAPIEALHYLRGEVLGRMDRPAEAEQEFLAELKEFPGSADARASLALLYAAWGRKADAREALRLLLASVPGPDGLTVAAQVATILGDTAQAEMFRDRARTIAAGGAPPARAPRAAR